MQRFTALTLVALVATGSTGCKLLSFFEKKVPDDIVQQVFEKALRHAPGVASAMCGSDVSGFTSTKTTIKSRGEKNTGIVHVVGTPWPNGDDDLPSKCEGDLEYTFTFTTKTYGSRRNRRTDTTWFLDKAKLTAVQTPGVKFKEAEESGDDDADEDTNGGDDKKATKGKDKGADKKKKGDDDDKATKKKKADDDDDK